jgi:hypothetical protein
MSKNHRSVTALQAAHENPSLAQLADLSAESKRRLQSLDELIPKSIHGRIQPGPIDGGTWCLLVENSAVAAKVRQLLPELQAQLRVKRFNVTSIRIKIQTKADSA